MYMITFLQIFSFCGHCICLHKLKKFLSNNVVYKNTCSFLSQIKGEKNISILTKTGSNLNVRREVEEKKAKLQQNRR